MTSIVKRYIIIFIFLLGLIFNSFSQETKPLFNELSKLKAYSFQMNKRLYKKLRRKYPLIDSSIYNSKFRKYHGSIMRYEYNLFDSYNSPKFYYEKGKYIFLIKEKNNLFDSRSYSIHYKEFDVNGEHVIQNPRFTRRKQYWSYGGGISVWDKENISILVSVNKRWTPRISFVENLGFGRMELELFDYVGFTTKIDLKKNHGTFLKRPNWNYFLKVGTNTNLKHEKNTIHQGFSSGVGIRHSLAKQFDVEFSINNNYIIGNNIHIHAFQIDLLRIYATSHGMPRFR